MHFHWFSKKASKEQRPFKVAAEPCGFFFGQKRHRSLSVADLLCTRPCDISFNTYICTFPENTGFFLKEKPSKTTRTDVRVHPYSQFNLGLSQNTATITIVFGIHSCMKQMFFLQFSRKKEEHKDDKPSSVL